MPAVFVYAPMLLILFITFGRFALTSYAPDVARQIPLWAIFAAYLACVIFALGDLITLTATKKRRQRGLEEHSYRLCLRHRAACGSIICADAAGPQH